MSNEVDYKLKYQELKYKYMRDVDIAYRLGFEDGSKQTQLNSPAQESSSVKLKNANMPNSPEEKLDTNNNDAPGAPQVGTQDKSGAPSVQPSSSALISENPDGTELDQHISKLESLISKSEVPTNELKETVDNLKLDLELKKSVMPILSSTLALHKPQFKFGVQANHNLDSTAKAALTMQHKIVNDIMTKWENEEKKASNDILSKLNVDNLIDNK